MRFFAFVEHLFLPAMLTGTSCGLIYLFASLAANGGTMIVSDPMVVIILELILSIILAMTGLVFWVYRMVKLFRGLPHEHPATTTVKKQS